MLIQTQTSVEKPTSKGLSLFAKRFLLATLMTAFDVVVVVYVVLNWHYISAIGNDVLTRVIFDLGYIVFAVTLVQVWRGVYNSRQQ